MFSHISGTVENPNSSMIFQPVFQPRLISLRVHPSISCLKKNIIVPIEPYKPILCYLFGNECHYYSLLLYFENQQPIGRAARHPSPPSLHQKVHLSRSQAGPTAEGKEWMGMCRSNYKTLMVLYIYNMT